MTFLEKCPEYKNYQCIFLYKGSTMDNDLTMKENKYESGDIILVNTIDF